MSALILARDPALREVLCQILIEMGLAVEARDRTLDLRWFIGWDLVVIVGEPSLDDDASVLRPFREIRMPLLYVVLDNRFPPPGALTLRAPFSLEELENAVRSFLGVGSTKSTKMTRSTKLTNTAAHG